MVTSDNTIGIVFNGAIYNHLELRASLSAYRFHSRSDTEVLLHGYAEWGIEELTSRLRGMFAFAVWDSRIQTLYLVRDRLGVKPLVYTSQNGLLAFASTVRALAAAGYSSDLDADAVRSFLHFGFVPETGCIYRGIHKLPPGCLLKWAGGRVLVSSYWTRPRSLVHGISFTGAVAKTEELLLDAVKVRLQADVPIAALLSGGIDSSLICWAADRLGADIQAFTVSAPGDPWDETAAARRTAAHLRLRHSVIELPLDETPPVAELIQAYAEPFACASALGMLRVSHAIASSTRIKVLLTGDGGDDVFLGYPRHRNFWLASRLSHYMPEVTRRLLGFASPVSFAGPIRRLTALLRYASLGLQGAISHLETLQERELSSLLGERLTPRRTVAFHPLLPSSGRTLLHDFLDYEYRTKFTGEYLTKVDGATMHYGIEARSPFLDQELWAFASTLPFHVRLHHGRLKAVLRQLVSNQIGPSVARRPKRGFGVPVQRWLTSRWRAWAFELLRESLLEREGWIRAGSALASLSSAVAEGSAPQSLWYVVVLESWFRREIQDSPRGSAPTATRDLLALPVAVRTPRLT